MTSEWQPIETAPRKPKKGYFRLYSYAPGSIRKDEKITKRCPYYLPRIYSTDSCYGSRVCDFYIDIPIPPAAEATHD